MLGKIETKIKDLQAGKKLILGSGIAHNEMGKVEELCENLVSDGLIRVQKIQKELPTGQKYTGSIIVEKL